MRICRTLKVLFAVVLLQSTFLASVAQTFTSVQTGPWENGATWGNNSPGQKGIDCPANNDNVIISSLVRMCAQLLNIVDVGCSMVSELVGAATPLGEAVRLQEEAPPLATTCGGMRRMRQVFIFIVRV